MIRATYRLNQNDLYQARAAHAGWSHRLIQIFGAFLILYGAIAVISAPRGQTALPIILGLVLVFRLRLANALTFKRDAPTRAETEFLAGPEEVVFRTGLNRGHIVWRDFLRYAETKRLWMLYTQPNVFHLVPKRALPATETASFTDLLQRHLGAKSASYAKKFSPNTGVLLAVIAIAITLVLWAVSHRLH